MSQREDTTVINAISAPDTKLMCLFDDLTEIQSANVSNRLSRLCSDAASPRDDYRLCQVHENTV